MALFSDRQDRGGIASTVANIADGFSRLLTQHLALARLELAKNGRVLGRELALLAACAPFVLAGYLMCCLALAVSFSRWLGLEGALLLVGGANLIGGGVGIYRVAQRLRRQPLLTQSSEELTRSAAALSEPQLVAKEAPDDR